VHGAASAACRSSTLAFSRLAAVAGSLGCAGLKVGRGCWWAPSFAQAYGDGPGTALPLFGPFLALAPAACEDVGMRTSAGARRLAETKLHGASNLGDDITFAQTTAWRP
jgi:hypothetical protein